MPLYEYVCKACKTEFEALLRAQDLAWAAHAARSFSRESFAGIRCELSINLAKIRLPENNTEGQFQ